MFIGGLDYGHTLVRSLESARIGKRVRFAKLVAAREGDRGSNPPLSALEGMYQWAYTWSRKPGHPLNRGWGFESSIFRVHNFTPRSVGVFQPFYSLSAKRLRWPGPLGGVGCPPGCHPARSLPRQQPALQGGCKPLVFGHGRFDTSGGDCLSAHGQSLWRAQIHGLTGASRVRLVVWSLDSQSRGGGSIPPRGTGVRTLKEGRPLMTLSSVRERGNVPPAPANNRLWCKLAAR